MIFIFGLLVFLMLIGLTLVLIGTIRKKGRWGLNLKPVICQKCKTPAPLFRKPTSIQEALWGGWTCTNCGCKMDKWGNEIAQEFKGDN